MSRKTVCITGASSGIGYATAKLFAEKGYNLILIARRKAKLEEIHTLFLKIYDVSITILDFDVRNEVACVENLNSLPKKGSEIDILINNAGLARGKEAIHEGDTAKWDQMIDTNIKGLLYITRIISPFMVEKKSGHIINICSTAGKEVYPGGNVYCATKHAVDALTKSFRIDLFKYNIRVSQVAPAMVEQTEFSLVRFDGDENKADIYKDFNPLKAIDVAETIEFIASRPDYVNVQDVVMMGTQQANSSNFNKTGRIFDT